MERLKHKHSSASLEERVISIFRWTALYRQGKAVREKERGAISGVVETSIQAQTVV